MSACDICGVLRNPMVNVRSEGSKNTANINKSSSVVSSSVPEKEIAVGLPSNAKSFDSSSALMSESRLGSVGEDTYSLLNGGQPQNISSSLNNMSLNLKSGSSKNVNAGRGISNAQYKPEKWMLPNPSEDKLQQLNLAIVGHVDSGKSTLSGRLLQLSGRISTKEMHKYEREAKLQGKGSFAYAWALDESAEERERGITMTVGVAYFDSKRYHVVLLDSPGHKDFVPNMISGATQADAAILVIDASVGSFEAGMDTTGGQTREHAQLIRSFGADQVIVAINKMDVVEYSKERFDTIKLQVGTFLRGCSFKDSSVSWVPLSAIENQNLMVAASDARLLSWLVASIDNFQVLTVFLSKWKPEAANKIVSDYGCTIFKVCDFLHDILKARLVVKGYKGPSLLDAIDSLQPPARDYLKPLVMPICDVIKLQPQGQVFACGKLETGALRSGSKVSTFSLSGFLTRGMVLVWSCARISWGVKVCFVLSRPGIELLMAINYMLISGLPFSRGTVGGLKTLRCGFYAFHSFSPRLDSWQVCKGSGFFNFLQISLLFPSSYLDYSKERALTILVMKGVTHLLCTPSDRHGSGRPAVIEPHGRKQEEERKLTSTQIIPSFNALFSIEHNHSEGVHPCVKEEKKLTSTRIIPFCNALFSIEHHHSVDAKRFNTFFQTHSLLCYCQSQPSFASLICSSSHVSFVTIGMGQNVSVNLS
ncbi:hypothetical protein U1Q18_030365 [Sarracenia purpurea var. burkii]